MNDSRLEIAFDLSFSWKLLSRSEPLIWPSRDAGVPYMLPSLFWNRDGGTFEASTLVSKGYTEP